MRLNHVTLIVSDFERSKAFYKGLGLIQIVDTPPRYARFKCPDGDETFSIEVTGKPPAPDGVGHPVGGVVVGDERAAALAAQGCAFTQPPTVMFYKWREAHLRDPDGYDVRLYRAGSYRLDPPWKIA